MILYPYTTPIILTDPIFHAYIGSGCDFADSTATQRKGSYFIAEQTVSSYLETLLTPTEVTGTWSISRFLLDPFYTDYAYVNDIHNLSFLNSDGDIYYSSAVSGVAIRNAKLGIVDVPYLWGTCAHSGAIAPYQVQMAYNAGLPSGTVYSANILMAMSVYANILLGEIIGEPSDGGFLGIKSWRNQEYAETRVGLTDTPFGTSSKAQLITKLLAPLRVYRHVGLGL